MVSNMNDNDGPNAQNAIVRLPQNRRLRRHRNKHGALKYPAEMSGELNRHIRKCSICSHPEREDIDHAFVNWMSAREIVDTFGVTSAASLYRHASATGLFQARSRNIRGALENVIECAEYWGGKPDTIVRAARVHAHINEDGVWVEPPKSVTWTLQQTPPKQNPNRDNKLLETPATATKQTEEAQSNRDIRELW
jgi:hypothetical protein